MNNSGASGSRPQGLPHGGSVYPTTDADQPLAPGDDRREGDAGLVISAPMFNQIVGHMAAAVPNEGVGLIAVDEEPGGSRAVGFYPGTNIDRSPTRYTMDPAEVMAAFRAIRSNGWRLGAIVHSHVGTAPRPSATDLREAFYPEALMLIVSLATGGAEARLWRTGPIRSADEVREVPLLITDDQCTG
jgi:[CysO sulfur-carrier protein]-S-L-cysteine hydrolase